MRELIELGIVDPAFVKLFYPRVRDRADIAVMRDERSGVIFLDRADHMDLDYYELMAEGSYWNTENRATAVAEFSRDDARRAAQFAKVIAGKDYLDVGCGTGGILDRLKGVARSIAGVEPQTSMRKVLTNEGHLVYRIIEDVPESAYDVISLFHVFEHLTAPLRFLNEARSKLRPAGTIIIEVPHARDVLFKLDAFKRFSLWSEHLILHTKLSLGTYLAAAGFANISVSGFQRYPLANHLGWLLTDSPTGEVGLPQFASTEGADVYERMLSEADMTDTLIAIGTRLP